MKRLRGFENRNTSQFLLDHDYAPQRTSDRCLTHIHLNLDLNSGNVLLALNRCCDGGGKVPWHALVTALSGAVLHTGRMMRYFIERLMVIIYDMTREDLIGLNWEKDLIQDVIITNKGYQKITSAAKFSTFTNRLSL